MIWYANYFAENDDDILRNSRSFLEICGNKSKKKDIEDNKENKVLVPLQRNGRAHHECVVKHDSCCSYPGEFILHPDLVSPFHFHPLNASSWMQISQQKLENWDNNLNLIPYYKIKVITISFYHLIKKQKYKKIIK